MKARLHSQFLSTDGLGGGTSNFIGDYSIVPVTAYAVGPEGGTFVVHRMLVQVYGTKTFQAQEYGNTGLALSKGIEIKVYTKDGAELISDLTGGKPILTNAEWGRQCYDVDVKAWGSGNEMLVARYTFAKHGAPIHLGPTDRISIVLSDDFQTGAIENTFLLQGVVS